MADQPVPRSRWRRYARRELWRFLELFALCGFVVVQPLLSVIGGSPDFFIFHGVNGGQVVALVALFVLVPPVALWAVGALAGLVGPRVRQAVHLLAVAGLFGLFAIELGKHLTGVRGALLVLLAAAVTAGILVGYVRLAAIRQVLRLAAVGPLVFVLLFAVVSPASAVVLADDRPSRGGAPELTGPHPPIVMIVLDELAMLSLLDESGQVDAGRFPGFARLAGDSTWYRNATGVSGKTVVAVPSMLTGRWPAEWLAPHYAAYPDNLFTLLGEVYRISASESVTELCPPWYCGDQPDRSRGGLPVALAESTSLLGEVVSPFDTVRNPYDDYAEPASSGRAGEIAAPQTTDDPQVQPRRTVAVSQPVRFQDFLTSLLTPSDRGGEFHFLHLLLPHTPWTYLPDGMRYYHEGSRPLPVDGPWWSRLALQRYQLQLEYTDLLVGEVLDELEEAGRYDESLVVLTADHGISLTLGNAGIRELGPDDPGFSELAWVPMFIKEPGQTTAVVEDGNWQHVDLLPTIADYAGVEVPWPVDGISWRREQRTALEKTFHPYPDQPAKLDGAARFGQIMADPTAIPSLPLAPLPELVGNATSDHPVVDAEVRVEVDRDAFEDVDLAAGIVPALVHGTLPDRVSEGTPLAIAVNGRIGAVVPVVAGDDGERQFAGLIENADLFVAGENQLELFLVSGDGSTLYRL